MAMGKYVVEKDQDELSLFVQNDYELMQMAYIGKSRENRQNAVVNDISLEDTFHNFFEEGMLTNNFQNQMLLTYMYACGNQDPYIDSVIGELFKRMYDDPPKDRKAQNVMLSDFAGFLHDYSLYNDKVGALVRFIDRSIESNTKVIRETEPGYSPNVPSEEEKNVIAANDAVAKSRFNDLKKTLSDNGWDFKKYPDDEELLRRIITTERYDEENGKVIAAWFINRTVGYKVYNAVDRDRVYREFEEFLNKELYENVAKPFTDFVGEIRKASKEEVDRTVVMTAQTTDLFDIITEIGYAVNNRGSIESMKGFGESDELFYDSPFIHESDFNNADRVFGEVFGKLVDAQKKLSDKVSGMSEVDYITDCFKIVKAGQEEPLDIKNMVKDRLIKADMYPDPEEPEIGEEEKARRIEENQKNMATLAKAYIIHEMQHRDTKIFYEPYLVDRQYHRNEPVGVYLDINHPKRVKLSDLDSNRVQHDTAILNGYNQQAGMLYGDNYHEYVRNAFEGSQLIKVRDPEESIRGLKIDDAKRILTQNGWDYKANPAEENYVIMLFNAYNQLGRSYKAVENSIEILLNSRIYGTYERNEVLRSIYQELREYRDDKTVDALCDYLLADLEATKTKEYTDKIKYMPDTHHYDQDKRINGANIFEAQKIMKDRGWEIDRRIDILLRNIYDAYQQNQPYSFAIESGLYQLANMPSDVSPEQMMQFYLNFGASISQFKGYEELNDLSDILSDLAHEAGAIANDNSKNYNSFALHAATTFGGGIYDSQIPEQVIAKKDEGGYTGIYSVENLNIKNVAALEEDNTIEVAQGLENPDEVKFKAETFEFEGRNWGDPEPENINYEIQFEFPEQQKILEDLNDFKLIRTKFKDELSEMAKALGSTKRQKDKELGEEGTGSPEYKNMAKALKTCVDVLSDYTKGADEVRKALSEFSKASTVYYNSRKSVFKKKDEGAVRLNSAEKGSIRGQEMLAIYDFTLQNISKDARAARISVNAKTVSEKELVLACAKMKDVTKESDLPRHTAAENVGIYEKLELRGKLIRKIKNYGKNLLKENSDKRAPLIEIEKKEIKISDYAEKHILKGYYNTVTSEDVTVETLKTIEQKLNDEKAYKKETADLTAEVENNKVFKNLFKKNPKTFFNKMNEIKAKAEELSANRADFLLGIKDAYKDQLGGDYSNYVIADGAPNQHGRLAQIVVAQILSKYPVYAQSIVADAGKGNMFEVLTGVTEKVEKYLEKHVTIKDASKNNTKEEIRASLDIKTNLNKSIVDESIMKKVIASAMTYKKEEVKKPAAKPVQPSKNSNMVKK